MKYVVLDGKTWSWKELLRIRREQQKAERQAKQLALFEMKEDCRPKSQHNVAGRFSEPTLFQDK